MLTSLFFITRVITSESGNPAADYALGLAYETGSGVEQNSELAIAHYERAIYGSRHHASVINHLVHGDF